MICAGWVDALDDPLNVGDLIAASVAGVSAILAEQFRPIRKRAPTQCTSRPRRRPSGCPDEFHRRPKFASGSGVDFLLAIQIWRAVGREVRLRTAGIIKLLLMLGQKKIDHHLVRVRQSIQPRICAHEQIG